MIRDDVGLEDDTLPGQGKLLAEVIELPLEDAGQVGVIVGNRGDMNLGGSRNLPQSSSRLDSHAPHIGFQSLRPRDATGRGGEGEKGRGGDSVGLMFRPFSASQAKKISLRRGQGQRQESIPHARRPQPFLIRATPVGSDDPVIQIGQPFIHSCLVSMKVESQFGPAQMLQVVIRAGFFLQISNGRVNSGMILALQCEKHQGGGTWNRRGEPTKHPAIAVVDAAVIIGSIEQ
jgi:hypothetical protein